MVTQPDSKQESDKNPIPVQEGIFYQPQAPDEKPYLIATKCSACGYVSFPGLTVCPVCVARNTMEEVHLSGRGKIDTFSVCFAALPGFKAPSIQAYINLEEGARIWALITGTEPDEEALKLGMDVELVIGKVRIDPEGNEIVSYQFKPSGSKKEVTK